MSPTNTLGPGPGQARATGQEQARARPGPGQGQARARPGPGQGQALGQARARPGPGPPSWGGVGTLDTRTFGQSSGIEGVPRPGISFLRGGYLAFVGGFGPRCARVAIDPGSIVQPYYIDSSFFWCRVSDWVRARGAPPPPTPAKEPFGPLGDQGPRWGQGGPRAPSAPLGGWGPFWANLSHSEPFCAILSQSGPSWAILAHSEPFWAILGHSAPF